MPFEGRDGKVAQEVSEKHYVYKDSAQCLYYFHWIGKSFINIVKIDDFGMMEITFPTPFHTAETLIKHSPNAKWVARSCSKGTKIASKTLIKPCQNATLFIAWATLHKPL